MRVLQIIDKVLRDLLLFCVRVYQIFVSPLLPQSCRFVPSCSHYAAEALVCKSLPRALWLILRRLMRCHPLSRGGFDPLP